MGESSTTVNCALLYRQVTKFHLLQLCLGVNEERERRGWEAGTIEFMYRPVDERAGPSRTSEPRESGQVFSKRKVPDMQQHLQPYREKRAIQSHLLLAPPLCPPLPENSAARAQLEELISPPAAAAVNRTSSP